MKNTSRSKTNRLEASKNTKSNVGPKSDVGPNEIPRVNVDWQPW
jgi:hypothetical protein